MLTLTPLSADVAASPQLAVADVAGVAAAGFRSVINNRPDREAPEQPDAASIEAAVKDLGLAYAHLPVHPAIQSADEAAALRRLLDTLPKPILLFCRSGARSTRLFNAARAI